MRVTRSAVTRTCAICERSLLMGEHALRFSPGGGEYVDVCPLCAEIAQEHGWMREGSPSLPTVPFDARRRKSRWAGLLGGSRRAEEAPVADEPILRRLSEPELAVVEAADLFNASAYRRTVAGVAKSLGAPKSSIVPLSGVGGEMVVTVAWECSGISTGSRRTRPSRSGSSSAVTTWRSSMRASRTGTRTSPATAA